MKSLTEQARVMNSDVVLNNEVVRLTWKKVAPPRAQFVVWLMCLGRLKTGAMLHRLDMEEDALCPFCNSRLEELNHVFFECNLSWNIWMKILNGGE